MKLKQVKYDSQTAINAHEICDYEVIFVSMQAAYTIQPNYIGMSSKKHPCKRPKLIVSVIMFVNSFILIFLSNIST